MIVLFLFNLLVWSSYSIAEPFRLNSLNVGEKDISSALSDAEVQLIKSSPKGDFIFISDEFSNAVKQVEAVLSDDAKENISLFGYINKGAKVIPVELLRLDLEELDSALLQMDGPSVEALPSVEVIEDLSNKIVEEFGSKFKRNIDGLEDLKYLLTEYLETQRLNCAGNAYIAGDLEVGGIIKSADSSVDMTRTNRGVFDFLGSVGPTGPAGAAGAMGQAGPRGLQGEQGPMGPAGVPGPKGDKGDLGRPGAPGERGERGPAGGPVGATGPQGPQGIRGQRGKQGDRGEQGLAGEKGDKGDQGLPGEKGDLGATGPKGAQGIQGARGDLGAVGPMGPKGADGRDGAPGLRGTAGPQGVRGERGLPGLQGKAGANGIGFLKSAIFSEQKEQGKSAGSSIRNTWKDRDLNKVNMYPANGKFAQVSVDSAKNPVITLQPGVYFLFGSAPAYQSDHHQTRIYNATDDIVEFYGQSQECHSGAYMSSQTNSDFSGIITVSGSSKDYKLQHITSKTKDNIGFGVAGNFAGAVEVYAILNVLKLE